VNSNPLVLAGRRCSDELSADSRDRRLRALCPVIAFHCLVLVGAKSNALPIRKHEPLMTATSVMTYRSFRPPGNKYILGHQPCGFVSATIVMTFWWSRVLSRAVAGNTCDGFFVGE
jgi:hypothetical protein